MAKVKHQQTAYVVVLCWSGDVLWGGIKGELLII